MATAQGKRHWQGDASTGPRKKAARPVPTSKYGPMFAAFRDHMDAHHDRRERVVKASRDVTALSKKMIFALQRVRHIQPELPADVARDVEVKLAEIGRLLAGVAPELQGLHRGRYGRMFFGLEELVEALTFRYYLQHQTLLDWVGMEAAVDQLCRDGAVAKDRGEEHVGQDNVAEAATVPLVTLDDHTYLMGVLDLSGEMMRFATTSAALQGTLTSDGDEMDKDNGNERRTIVSDMQALDSFLRMLPQRHDKGWKIKMQVLQTSVQKVERLGYDLRVRGSEWPKGWVPDTGDEPAEVKDIL